MNPDMETELGGSRWQKTCRKYTESAKWLDLNRHTQSLVAATNVSITFSREIFVIQQ